MIPFIGKAIRRIKGIRKNLVYEPSIVSKPKGKRVVVIAPHFDDAALGCGGVLRKHVISGNKVSVVYLTDGRQGIPRIKDKKRVERIRKEEARNAMDIIGVKNIYFLDEPDCGKGIKEKTIHNLSAIITKTKPDLIYLPWFLDSHVDHVKANYLIYRMYKKTKITCKICAYEIWAPLVPNILVDISKEVETKKEAIRCFTSQLEQIDYLSTAIGLNKYRTCYNLKGKGYAEAFLHLPIKEYFEAFLK